MTQHQFDERIDTLMGPLAVVRATAAEVETVAGLLDEAGTWLHGQGIVKQWPLQNDRNWVAEQVAANPTFVFLMDNRPLATLTLQWSDPEVWGDDDGQAGYVHRLAVTRGYSGLGLGAALLDWAGREIAKTGRQLIRLDCWAGNTSLIHYYQQVGFTLLRTIAVGEWEAALFERAAIQVHG